VQVKCSRFIGYLGEVKYEVVDSVWKDLVQDFRVSIAKIYFRQEYFSACSQYSSFLVWDWILKYLSSLEVQDIPEGF